MSDADQIRTIRSQALAVIAQITAAPKPSYEVDGQRVAWGDYLAQLRATVEWCDRQLAGDDPFELHTTGGTP
ncbi:MAG: hypothetical protein HYS13_01390 [Planctomycetia bacterium]|nr:hypothetical protein [Planctomycetia bacterium]